MIPNQLNRFLKSIPNNKGVISKCLSSFNLYLGLLEITITGISPNRSEKRQALISRSGFEGFGAFSYGWWSSCVVVIKLRNDYHKTHSKKHGAI